MGFPSHFQMKLKCAQSDLAAALSIANRAVSPNNTLPVLNNVLLRAEGKHLFLSATNLEIAINVAFEANIENEGSLTLPAKSLSSYIGLLNNENVQLTVLNGTTLEISSTGSKTEMKGISSEEFPLLPKLDKSDSFVIPTKELQKAIEQVAFAASTNISRPVLTGIYWQIAGKTMKLVATDSYRLAERTLELEKDLSLDLSFIVPSKTAQELARILGSTNEKELTVQVGKGQILFKLNGIELISRLIEGNYPPYEKILPKESKTSAELNRHDFILGLKKVSVIVQDSNNNVRTKLDGDSLRIASDETQVGKGTVDLQVKGDGPPMEAALNVQYLLEVLSHMDGEKVFFGLNDALSPVKVVPVQTSGYLYIIMPLKI